MVRIIAGLTRDERRRLVAMFGFITLLHLVGWGVLVFVVAPQHLSVGGKVYGVGLGATAYFFGMRHAFDADHIAAIDNTTRALMDRRQRPLSVGFWFSLGHSSVVLALFALFAFGVRALVGQVAQGDSALHGTTGIIGVLVSGLFLLFLGAFNFVVLLGLVRMFRAMRSGEVSDDELQRLLDKRGLFARILLRLTDKIRTPAHMYPVGLLFGFGFDTATSVSFLVIASAGALYVLPWYALLCLPVLFAAGMCLFDTIDGTFMNFAYGWAFSQPIRKVYYNLTITSLSIFVAWFIGGIELLSLLADRLDLKGGFWTLIGAVGDFQYTGYLVVGLFVLTWAVSVGIWKFGRIEERWALAGQNG